MILAQNLTWFYRPFLAKKASQKCMLKRQETWNHIDFTVNRTLFYRTSYFPRQKRIKCNYELHT